MKVLQLGTDIEDGEYKMKRNEAYVMSDPIAQHYANTLRDHVQKFEIFEPYYNPYMGQNLNNKSIAIWRTGGYGDLLFITPIVEYLKRRYPTCKISVATSERFRDVWANNPNIDPILSAFSLPLKLSFIKRHTYAGIFEGTIENFKDNKQYCAMDAFAYNLGIFDMPLELKRPRYYLTEAEINAAKNKIRSEVGFNIVNEPYIVFQWKSSSQLRDYPYDKLVSVMHKLQQITGYKIIILTHPSYRSMVTAEVRLALDHVIPEPRVLDYLNLAGVTSYRESAAVLALSTGLVGIDSSLTHLAAALGVPSVSIYGPFKAEWRTVYNPNNISLQKQHLCPKAPCAYHSQPNEKDGLPIHLCTNDGMLPQYSKDKFCRVMSGVTVDEIVEAYIKLLELQKSNNLPIRREFRCAI